MIIPISMQFRLMIFSFTAGIITGILFDLYRIIRGFTNLNKLVVFIEDILFWTFAGISVFVFLFYTNYAYTDVYVYLWIALGIYMYFKLLSKIFFNMEKIIFKSMGRLNRMLINTIMYPFYYFKSKKRKNRKK
ncbi:spore cortex biosynthesis protein YabQ [Clostridium algifaecis]|uniref:Spore cortex biosynthesis protein YabQ n=1 Tax=Clostridium algifaecis TaxID=1472040 RepID=A0ABS4KV54_9CLOT|nr:spore cortex biosynthesis protein YabQ [Clostridium algifaecis]MBP2033929.1 spore cortex biosynthesis protein YabQ [Clostridium algifaecis]